MPYPLHEIFLSHVKLFINDLSLEDQRKIAGASHALAKGEFESVYVKHIQGSIRELRVKNYRLLLFFICAENVYFSSIFIKTTQKTPLIEIKKAEKFYKLITK